MIALVEVTVTDMVGLNERGAFAGIVALSWAFGTVLGPIIGGAIAENTTWRWYQFRPISILMAGSSISISQSSSSPPLEYGSSSPFEPTLPRSARSLNTSIISASSSLSEAQRRSSSDLLLVGSSSPGYQQMSSPLSSSASSVWFYSGLLKTMLSKNP